MANTIARAIGYDAKREKVTTRLGSVAARAEACTWRTTVTAFVHADGSGYMQVVRDGYTLYHFSFEAEPSEVKSPSL